jgi:hypothetical protein
MFDWIRKLFDSKCDFYNTCKYKRSGFYTCENGPIYFEGIDVYSYCGQHRKMAGWED